MLLTLSVISCSNDEIGERKLADEWKLVDWSFQEYKDDVLIDERNLANRGDYYLGYDLYSDGTGYIVTRQDGWQLTRHIMWEIKDGRLFITPTVESDLLDGVMAFNIVELTNKTMILTDIVYDIYDDAEYKEVTTFTFKKM